MVYIKKVSRKELEQILSEHFETPVEFAYFSSPSDSNYAIEEDSEGNFLCAFLHFL